MPNKETAPGEDRCFIPVAIASCGRRSRHDLEWNDGAVGFTHAETEVIFLRKAYLFIKLA